MNQDKASKNSEDIQGWVEEIHRGRVGLKFPYVDRLFSEQSSFQKVEIYETLDHGRLLLNDGCVMLSDRDEFIYHEMIAHVPLFTHPMPKKVLVIGGGDGGTAREVLRHKSVEHCVMVEIDKVVVEASREFLPQTACAFKDHRLELLIADGVEYVKSTDQVFDIVIVDSTDPVGPAQPLFGSEFYQGIYEILDPEGIVVAQGESPFYEAEMQKKLVEIIASQFPITSPYNFSNMTYPGGYWSFMFGSKKYHPLKDFSQQSVQNSGLVFNYYNADMHRASFSCPEFMRKNLATWIQL